jgi:hypothetical protein
MRLLDEDVILEALAAGGEGEMNSEDWLHGGLEDLGVVFEGEGWQEQYRLLGVLLRRLESQGLVDSELRGLDLYDRYPYYRLSEAGRARVPADRQPPSEPPSLLGPRSRRSPLAERQSHQVGRT